MTQDPENPELLLTPESSLVMIVDYQQVNPSILCLALALGLGGALASPAAHAGTAEANASLEASPQGRRTHFGTMTQVIEIIGLAPQAHHNTVLLSTGLSVAHAVSPQWTLIGGLGFAASVDAVSYGGSVTFAADYNFYREGALRIGAGPDLVLVHNRVDMGSAGWGNVSVVGPGAGVTLGYAGANLNLGLGSGYTPQLGGSWSLAPHIGIGASFE